MNFKTESYSMIEGERLTYLRFDSLEQAGLIHAFTTRIGGVSTGYLASSNFGLNCGDLKEHVEINTRLLQKELGIEDMPVIRTNQKHSDRVETILNKMEITFLTDKNADFPVDGLITHEKNIALLSIYADCVPVYILDNKKHIMGIIHSGWMGTVKKIVPSAIQKMVEVYSVSISDMIVVIGPSIQKCCFEIEEDVIIKLSESYKWTSDYCKQVSEIKYLADLQSIIAHSAFDMGIGMERISMVDLCTKCRQDLFYSHRGSKGLTGRMAAITAMKP